MANKMRKHYFILSFLITLLTILNSVAFCHTEKIQLIVDTDMSLDDIRALAMLLNDEMFDVRLIICTEGSTTPDTGATHVAKILRLMKRQSTTFVTGKKLDYSAPFWRNIAESLKLPETGTPVSRPANKDSIKSIILEQLPIKNGRVIYLCLGPLTNLAEALKQEPELKARIDKIVFYGAEPDITPTDFNYSYDPDSAEYVFTSGLDIYAIRIPEDDPLVFSNEMLCKIASIGSSSADLIAFVHNVPEIAELIEKSHLRVWDELTVVYLYNPALFQFNTNKEKPYIKSMQDFDRENVVKAYYQLLVNPVDRRLDSRETVVLKKYPTEPELFQEDIEPFVEEIIKRHGFEEWKTCLLTNELHRHLGIYSILGAKMGIRAREILGAPFDELEVVSFAGFEPPLSCMNDGLQVSTGASLGRGTITVEESMHKPRAEFTYKKKKLKLKLRNEILSRIKADIKFLTEKYGQLTPEYYSNLRALSIKYWLEMDRKSIFEEIDQQSVIRE